MPDNPKDVPDIATTPHPTPDTDPLAPTVPEPLPDPLLPSPPTPDPGPDAEPGDDEGGITDPRRIHSLPDPLAPPAP